MKDEEYLEYGSEIDKEEHQDAALKYYLRKDEN
jgi:hypothetical protein